MSIYEKWEQLAHEERSQQEHNKFWEEYFDKERAVYEKILESNSSVVSGKIEELSKEYGMDSTTFIGFIDGINTSLEEEIDLEKLEEDTEVSLNINFEKLYFNMLDAKAPWLYELPQWSNILSTEKIKEITKEYRATNVVRVEKIGRNEPCPCGSGKKYKKCCGK